MRPRWLPEAPLLALLAALAAPACGDATSSSTDAETSEQGASATTEGDATDTASTAGPGPGEPLTAPEEQWTWIELADTRCANGDTTGVGVNLTSRGPNVIIYLEGGGACWDEVTCYALESAAFVTTGFGQAEFAARAVDLNGSLFNRSDPNNPLRDYSYIYVPYCTGDLHAGSNIASYGPTGATHHVGYDNITALVERLAPTFPDAERVVLSGSSAGGYGAQYNWGRVQDHLGDVRVDLLNDCGPLLPNPYLSEALEGAWRSSWGLDGTLPPGCEACADELGAALDYDLARLSGGRAGLLAFADDPVVSLYFGIDSLTYKSGLDALIANTFDAHDHAQVFVVDASDHVMIGAPSLVSQNGVVLLDWITQLLDDDPAWASVTP